MRIDVALTAETVAPWSVVGAAVVVIDVLRASTTIIAALASGCRAVVPVRDVAEASRQAQGQRGGVLRAGERRGEPIEGFDLGNSPVEVTPERVRGKTVIFTTSNGTRALLAARGAPAVAVGGLVNLEAAARWARDQRRDVTIICAGERGAVSLEDQVCAGLLVDRLATALPEALLTITARDASTTARPYRGDIARLRTDSPWARHLIRSGRGTDVDACLSVDTSSLVPVYLSSTVSPNGVDEVVAGHG